MPGIVTASIRRSGAGCDHRTVTVNLDGSSFEIDTGEGVLDGMPWDADAKRQFILLGLRRLRALGLTLDDAVNRVTNGDEGSNVRSYDIITKDITKTNIGTAYVDVPAGANGERVLLDFTGCTQYRLILHANLVGSGPFGFRLVRDSDDAVLHENASIALTDERELDTDWQTLPAAASGLQLARLQAKSTTGADDPVVRRCILLVR